MSKLTLSDLGDVDSYTTTLANINTNNAAIEAAFDNTLSRDGSTPNTMLADIDLNSNHIINLADPLTDSEPVTLGYSKSHNSNSFQFGTAAGTVAEGNDTRIVNAVPNTRQVIAGNGFSGGGDLTVDRTLNVGAGTGIIINPDTVEVIYGTTTGTAAEGDDSRIVGAVQASNNLSDLADISVSRTNLGVAIGTDVQAHSANLDTFSTKTPPTGTVVGTSDTQTLTGKTLTSPTISGGTVNSASVGATTPASGKFTTLTATGAITASAVTAGTPDGRRPVLIGLDGVFVAGNGTLSSGNFRQSLSDPTGTGVAVFNSAPSISNPTLTNIPTTDPAVAGKLWNDAGTLKISAG